MKTLFSVGFQANNPFTVRHPSLVQAPSLGRPMALPQAPSMGDVLDDKGRAKIQSIITSGKAKLAQVDAWIQTQYAKDPTLLATFKEEFVVDNWRGYDDIVTKDQYYVDLAAQKIASSDPINYDFTEETLSRIDEWAQVIDIMVAGMQQYGGVALKPTTPGIVKLGPTTTGIISPSTGAPVQTRIAPGATLTTPPPTDGFGISPKTLLISGGVLAAVVGLVLALKG